MIFDKSHSQINPDTSIIVCEENKMKYIAHNRNSAVVYKFMIDGEIFTDRVHKRCDYLVENETTKAAFFIELKGVNLEDAFVQLRETIILLMDRIREYDYHCRVVCSRVTTHSVNSSEYRNLKKVCKDIIYKTKKYEEDI